MPPPWPATSYVWHVLFYMPCNDTKFKLWQKLLHICLSFSIYCHKKWNWLTKPCEKWYPCHMQCISRGVSLILHMKFSSPITRITTQPVETAVYVFCGKLWKVWKGNSVDVTMMASGWSFFNRKPVVQTGASSLKWSILMCGHLPARGRWKMLLRSHYGTCRIQHFCSRIQNF